MKVTTLTVENPAGQVVTTVHYDERAARAALRADYGGPDLDDVPEDELIQTLIDEYGLVIYIAEHDVPEPPTTPEPELTRHMFVLGANVRSWHRFFVTGLTPEQAMILDDGGDEAVALAHQLDEAGRLEAGGVDYEEAPPIWDEASDPDIIDFEEDS